MRILLIALFSTVISFSVNAKDLTCKEKQAEVERQIEYAEKNNNKRRLKGLERALENLKENCTDKALADKKAEKIEDAKEDVAEAQEELDEAVKNGKSSKKIEKKKRKLEKKQLELNELL